MKNGEFYGAVLSRLNRGISYLNMKNLEDETGLDRNEVNDFTNELCKHGLARKINDTEFELICDIGQLRGFVMQKQIEDVPKFSKGEYSDDAEKPISLSDIADADNITLMAESEEN